MLSDNPKFRTIFECVRNHSIILFIQGDKRWSPKRYRTLLVFFVRYLYINELSKYQRLQDQAAYQNRKIGSQITHTISTNKQTNNQIIDQYFHQKVSIYLGYPELLSVCESTLNKQVNLVDLNELSWS